MSIHSSLPPLPAAAKLAFAGKGGAGKTTLAAWTADYLARRGLDVWMIDADTALSLGAASGLAPQDLPIPLAEQADLIHERIGSGLISLTPQVGDLPEVLSVAAPLGGPPLPGCRAGRKRLLVMGTVQLAGGGCACEANALLKALLAHLMVERNAWVLVDLEAGVEHLGRGTVASVDGLAVVSEPSFRSLETAARVAALGTDLGIRRQVLFMNRTAENTLPNLPDLPGLPASLCFLPRLPGLEERMLLGGSVLGLAEAAAVDAAVESLLRGLFSDAGRLTAP